MIDSLLQPFQYEFFTRGIAVAIMVGAACGILGVYIILRGLSYIGHGVSHAVFGGAVVSYIININLYIGAALWGFLSVFLINEISRRSKIKADAAIGVVTTAGFAVGVLLISTTRSFTRNFEAILFGNILGITDQDLLMIFAASVITALFVIFFHKRLIFTIFDKETAKVYGVKTEHVETIFSLVLATVVIASMSAIGVTLLAAAIVAPAVSARMLTNNFQRMILISTVIGAITSFAGMYASFYLDSASGATIVLFSAAAFGMSALYSFLRRKYHTHSHAGMIHAHAHSHTAEHRHEH
jgi:manganese/iron transport system permease protein/iron/zinc/copper transport system permease protein